MKRFQYELETVLEYKNQMLDDLKLEHARIVNRVNRKQDEIRRLHEEMTAYEASFEQTKQQGTSIESYRLFGMCIDKMEKTIDEENDRLEELKKKEAAKKEEVVEAKIDTSKFEKLKEKRWQNYQKAEQKAEEAFVEEFVTRGYQSNMGNHG